MEKKTAEKITTELVKFSDKRFAVTNSFGEVQAKTESFSIGHNILDIKSKKAIPLKFESKRIGYLYFDENQVTVNEYGNVFKSMAELIIHQSYFTEILTSEEKRADQLMYDFLNQEDGDLDEFKKVFSSFGINLSKNRLAIFLEIADPNYLFLYEKEIIEGERERKIARIKRGVESVLSSFYTHHQDNLVFYIGGSNFVVFKDMGNDPKAYQEEFKKMLNSLYYNIKTEMMTEVTLGVGEYKNGLLGLRESYDEARTALRFGKQTWGSGKIYHFDTFGVVAPLFSGITGGNISFSREIINSLSKYPDLLASLKYYFEYDLSLSKTAKKLRIHRNTLVYRLEKIAEVTGFDPRVFNEAFQLQLALIMEKYNERI